MQTAFDGLASLARLEHRVLQALVLRFTVLGGIARAHRTFAQNKQDFLAMPDIMGGVWSERDEEVRVCQLPFVAITQEAAPQVPVRA